MHVVRRIHNATTASYRVFAVAGIARRGHGDPHCRPTPTVGFGCGRYDRSDHHTSTPRCRGIAVGLYRIAAAGQRRNIVSPKWSGHSDPLFGPGDGGPMVRGRPYFRPGSAERQLRQTTRHDRQFEEQFERMEPDSRPYQQLRGSVSGCPTGSREGRSGSHREHRCQREQVGLRASQGPLGLRRRSRRSRHGDRHRRPLRAWRWFLRRSELLSRFDHRRPRGSFQSQRGNLEWWRTASQFPIESRGKPRPLGFGHPQPCCRESWRRFPWRLVSP